MALLQGSSMVRRSFIACALTADLNASLEYPASILPKVTMRRKCINYPKSWSNATADGQHNGASMYHGLAQCHGDRVAQWIQLLDLQFPTPGALMSMPRKCDNVDATQEHQCMHKFKPVNALASSPNAAQIGLLSGQFLRFCLSGRQLSHALILDIDIDRQEHKDRLRTDFVRS
ncbi:hypothetical protein EV122DRAFT_252727 [Schizophyllum commune]